MAPDHEPAAAAPPANAGSPTAEPHLSSGRELESLRPPPIRGLLERLADSRFAQFELASVHRLPKARLVLAGTAVVVLAFVGWRLTARPPAAPVDNQLPRAAAPVGSSVTGAGVESAGPGGSGSGGSAGSGSSTAAVVVHVAGAVERPGVRSLRAHPRVADALTAAGGPTPDADLDRLNLAAPIADGQRIYVPHRGEAAPPQVLNGASPGAGGSATGGGGSPGSPGGGPVDLNTATAEQLDTLPGVGPATAQAIISYREQHGGFKRVADLQDVRGIGDARYAQLEPLVSVSGG